MTNSGFGSSLDRANAGFLLPAFFSRIRLVSAKIQA
jgi:hypothetical protein